MAVKILWSLFISMVPVIELRGAIPVAAGLGLPWWVSFSVCVIGSMLPVPIILILVKRVLHWMQGCKVGFFRKISAALIRKSENNKDKITKYATFGLLLFVAIPLPGTGAWTGSLVAAMLEMKFKNAMLSIAVGIVIAGVIVTAISYGVLGFLSWML